MKTAPRQAPFSGVYTLLMIRIIVALSRQPLLMLNFKLKLLQLPEQPSCLLLSAPGCADILPLSSLS